MFIFGVGPICSGVRRNIEQMVWLEFWIGDLIMFQPSCHAGSMQRKS